MGLECNSSCAYNIDQADNGWGVWGMGPFRIDSSICRAAFVAGVIGHKGGPVYLYSAGQEPEFVPYGVLMRQAFCFKHMRNECKFHLAKPDKRSYRKKKSSPKRKKSKSKTWTLVLSNMKALASKDVGEKAFNTMFGKSGDLIIKRVCKSCRSEYREMYYRRYTALSKAKFNAYDNMKQNWFKKNNVLNKDFGIFSSYKDAMAKKNPWKFCNYDDPGVGFPRDCGIKGAVGNQWNAFKGSRHVRASRQVAYYIHA